MWVNKALFELCKLSDSLEGEDTFHQRRVCFIAYNIAKELKFDEQGLNLVVKSALLHDIGLLTDESKVETFRNIIYEDFELLNKHAIVSGKIARFFNMHLDVGLAITLHHTPHENNTSVIGNILFLADNVEIAYRSLTNPYAYDDLIDFLEQKRELFNPDMFDVLKSIAKKECFWFSLLENHVDDAVLEIVDQLPKEDMNEKLKTAIVYLISYMTDNIAPFYDKYSLYVKNISVNLGYKLGLDTRVLHNAALLSHVGNLKIPYDTFKMPSLDEETYNIVKSHTFEGYHILKRLGFDREAELVLLHHENNTREGYPCRIKPEREAAVLGLATIVAAIMQDRPYRGARSDEKIKEGLGNFRDIELFDKEILDAAIDIDLEKVRKTEDEYYTAVRKLFA